MRRPAFLMVPVLLILMAAAYAEQPQQSARQALLEMFFGKSGSLEKHLPEATKAALLEMGGNDLAMLQMLPMLTGQLNGRGQRLQTFETGPSLLVYEDEKSLSKFEITVESDDLRGDEDEIAVAFNAWKDGQPQSMGVSPLLTFLMKSERGTWRLNTLSLTVRVPLGDPEFLKKVVENAKQRQALAARAGDAKRPGQANVDTPPSQNLPNENSALASMRTILSAETTYARLYPARGFTCLLSDLDGFGQDIPNEHHAMLIESRLASGKKQGYVFTLSGCTAAAASHFVLVAAPTVPGPGRTYCADESGVVRSSPDGQIANCMSNGKPVE